MSEWFATILYCSHSYQTFPSRWGASPSSIENEDEPLSGSSYLCEQICMSGPSTISNQKNAFRNLQGR